MKKNACTFECLAATEFAQILFCQDCQVIHLQLQTVTLRFSMQSFIAISDTLSSAATRLKAVSHKHKQAQQHKLTLVK
ncbi:MAG: hypothetical protein ABL925_08555 [Methylococcales bacterium]